MNDPSRFKSKILLSLVLLVVVVALCYAYVDRPVSFFLESLHLSYLPSLRFFEHIPVVIVNATVVYLMLWPLLPERIKAHLAARALLKITVTAALADFTSDLLKGYFGRYWPRTWTFDNPSLIDSNTYGFKFFSGGPWYRSFPSGHACMAMATATAIALCFPRTWVKVLVACAAGSTMTTVLLQNFHFVGDLFAGAWLGTVTALCVHRAWPSITN